MTKEETPRQTKCRVCAEMVMPVEKDQLVRRGRIMDIWRPRWDCPKCGERDIWAINPDRKDPAP